MLSLSKQRPEPAEPRAAAGQQPNHRELPDFLKQGFPDTGLPPAKRQPGALRFPEIPPPREPWGHDRAASVEWSVREWIRLVELGLIGGN